MPLVVAGTGQVGVTLVDVVTIFDTKGEYYVAKLLNCKLSLSQSCTAVVFQKRKVGSPSRLSC